MGLDETRRQIIASIQQEGEDGPLQEGESEPLNEFLLYVYPNPADKAVNVNYFMSEPGSYRITLSDAAGKLVYGRDYGNREQGWQQVVIETSGLPNGIYMLVLESNRERKVKKIIIPDDEKSHIDFRTRVGSFAVNTYFLHPGYGAGLLLGGGEHFKER